MAKYFLGSVGKAEAFRRNASTGALEVAFVSKTLTDSGLNISTTKDDIRAGEGAPVQFSFYHDSNVEITLTDVLWKSDYLAAQLGARFEVSTEDYVTKEVSFTAGSADATDLGIQKIPFPCGEDYLVWATKKGTDGRDLWQTVDYDADTKKLTLANAEGDYCVRFLGTVSNARAAEITSTIIPDELFLIITAPLFAGDACAASRGRAAGHITFEVPRFQLNGAQEFAMNMSQNQTMSLSGIAMATESAECDANGGKLLRIIEVINDRDYMDEADAIVADETTSKVGSEPAVYAVLKDEQVVKADNSKLEFLPEGSVVSGKYAEAASGKEVTINYYRDGAVALTCKTTVAAS